MVSRRSKLCFLVENKVKSKERKGQLERCLNVATEYYGADGYSIVPVYLTLNGDDPSLTKSSSGYIPATYETVLEILESLHSRSAKLTTSDSQVFVGHYIETLRKILMNDDELTTLCKAIYRKHRKAIDLIVEYGATTEIYDACRDVVHETFKGVEYSNDHRGRYWFLPSEFASKMKTVELTEWRYLSKSYPVFLWFRHKKQSDRLQLTVEVGPVEDSELRRKITNIFGDHGMKTGKGELFTRVLTETVPLNSTQQDASDLSYEDMKEKAQKLVEKVMQKLVPVYPDIEKLFKGL